MIQITSCMTTCVYSSIKGNHNIYHFVQSIRKTITVNCITYINTTTIKYANACQTGKQSYMINVCRWYWSMNPLPASSGLTHILIWVILWLPRVRLPLRTSHQRHKIWEPVQANRPPHSVRRGPRLCRKAGSELCWRGLGSQTWKLPMWGRRMTSWWNWSN